MPRGSSSGVGGSATTDGGPRRGDRALGAAPGSPGVDLVVACDVTHPLRRRRPACSPRRRAPPRPRWRCSRRRLERLAQVYEDDFGVDVRDLPGSGAAGGPGRRARRGRRHARVRLRRSSPRPLDLAERLERRRPRGHRRGLPRRAVVRRQGRRREWPPSPPRAPGARVVAVVGDADPPVDVPAGVEVVIARGSLRCRPRRATAACLADVAAGLATPTVAGTGLAERSRALPSSVGTTTSRAVEGRARRRRGNQPVTKPARCQCPIDEEVSPMPYVAGLRCRECGREYPGRGAPRLRLLLRAARGRLRPRRRPQHRSPARGSRPGPRSIWRWADLLPAAPPGHVDLGAGGTPLVRADRLAAELGLGELWLKNDTVNPTGSFKDRVVSRGPRQGPRARLQGRGLPVHRQPGQLRGRPRGPGRHARASCSSPPTSSPPRSP